MTSYVRLYKYESVVKSKPKLKEFVLLISFNG